MGLLNSVSFQRLQGGIAAANLRQNVLANNVANMDVPGFKRSDVSFENILQKQEGGLKPQLRAKVTDPRHIQFGAGSTVVPVPSVSTDAGTAMNNNDNNVDIDREMALSAENQLRYNSYVSQVNSQISMLRTVIEGR